MTSCGIITVVNSLGSQAIISFQFPRNTVHFWVSHGAHCRISHAFMLKAFSFKENLLFYGTCPCPGMAFQVPTPRCILYKDRQVAINTRPCTLGSSGKSVSPVHGTLLFYQLPLASAQEGRVRVGGSWRVPWAGAAVGSPAPQILICFRTQPGRSTTNNEASSC